MPKTILITGASSFLGAHVAQYLSPYHRVIGQWCSTPLHLANVESLQWNLLSSKSSLSRQNQDMLKEVDCVVHLAGKIQNTREQTAHQCNRAMMERVIDMGLPILYGSSTAVYWPTHIPYVQSRIEDERRLQNSSLPYVILRPCAPYGPKLLHHRPKHQESFQTLVNTIRRSPVIPIIGNGRYLRQPVHVHDFAELVRHFVENGYTQRAWDVAGGSAHSFAEIIAILQEHLHTQKRSIHIPKRIATFASRFVPNLEPSLISVIDTDEAFDVTELSKLVAVRGFRDGVKDLL